MLKVYGRCHTISPGEWKQSCEVLHNGLVVGFVDHEKTAAAEETRTRNMRGEVMEGECLDWLLQKK